MKVEAFLERLENVQSRGARKWSARCRAHADRSPSLSIRETNNRILIHCFGGCEPREIVEALDLTLSDLFIENTVSSNHEPIPALQKLDSYAVAFQFELGALDRRLRAEKVLKAARHFHPNELSDQQLDQLLNATARAYSDCEHANFLETAADGLRVKAFHESEEHHAA